MNMKKLLILGMICIFGLCSVGFTSANVIKDQTLTTIAESDEALTGDLVAIEVKTEKLGAITSLSMEDNKYSIEKLRYHEYGKIDNIPVYRQEHYRTIPNVAYDNSRYNETNLKFKTAAITYNLVSTSSGGMPYRS